MALTQQEIRQRWYAKLKQDPARYQQFRAYHKQIDQQGGAARQQRYRAKLKATNPAAWEKRAERERARQRESYRKKRPHRLLSAPLPTIETPSEWSMG